MNIIQNCWPYLLSSNIIGKKNALLNLINNEPDTDKIYWYAKDLYEAKYQLLINKRESTGLKHFNDWIFKWYG